MTLASNLSYVTRMNIKMYAYKCHKYEWVYVILASNLSVTCHVYEYIHIHATHTMACT